MKRVVIASHGWVTHTATGSFEIAGPLKAKKTMSARTVGKNHWKGHTPCFLAEEHFVFTIGDSQVSLTEFPGDNRDIPREYSSERRPPRGCTVVQANGTSRCSCQQCRPFLSS